MPYLIGITGNSGCGKSTVLAILREAGYRVMDFDAYSIAVIQEAGNPVRARLEEILGETVADNGVVNFKKIGAYFDTHVDEEIRFDRWYQEYLGGRIRSVLAQQCGDEPVFVDMPLVRQRNMTGAFDLIWIIRADLNTCRRRIRHRNQYDDTKIEYLITRSLVTDEIYQQPVMIIHNDGTLEEYRRDILAAAVSICNTRK